MASGVVECTVDGRWMDGSTQTHPTTVHYILYVLYVLYAMCCTVPPYTTTTHTTRTLTLSHHLGGKTMDCFVIMIVICDCECAADGMCCVVHDTLPFIIRYLVTMLLCCLLFTLMDLVVLASSSAPLRSARTNTVQYLHPLTSAPASISVRPARSFVPPIALCCCGGLFLL